MTESMTEEPAVAIKTYRVRMFVLLGLSVLSGGIPLVTGIPALVCSYRVSTSLGQGDLPGAARASRRTLVLCRITLGIMVLYLMVLIGAAAYGVYVGLRGLPTHAG